MDKLITLPCSSDMKMATMFSSGSHRPSAYSSSSPIVSLPIRTLGSARSFAKRREVNRTKLSRESSKLIVTQNLIKGIKSEITTVEEDFERFCDVEGSDAFPFEIITRLGYGLKTTETELKRELDDEIIRVSVDYDTDEEEDDDEEDDKDEEENKYDDEEEESGVPMKVSILQRSTGQQLELDVIAFPDEICVDNISIKKPEHSDRDFTKAGGEYVNLHSNADLQKELVEYLEIKGVNPNTFELWKALLKNKKGRESVVKMKKP